MSDCSRSEESDDTLSGNNSSCSSASVSEESDSDNTEGASCRLDDGNHQIVEDKYCTNLRLWTNKVPIGLGLCPWAGNSRRLGRLSYVTCKGTTPAEVLEQLLREACVLSAAVPSDNDTNQTTVPPLSTTLLVCPHVLAWQEEFEPFDSFVRSIQKADSLPDDLATNKITALKGITFVCFHPKFLRWRGLPNGIEKGSTVRSHRGMAGFSKSQERFPATVVETTSKMFGRRKVKLRFHGESPKEQYVAVEWLVFDDDENDDETEAVVGPALPDNAMHRSPYPTIHLIRNADLGALTARDVSRTKRMNAKRMLLLGWEGLHNKLSIDARSDTVQH